MTFTITGKFRETAMHFARVEVEPVRMENNFGETVEVTGFWLNGPQWPTAEGFKIKKNGERFARKGENLSVRVPDEIHHALLALTIEEN